MGPTEGARLEDVRIEMEPYLALFEPDRKTGGYVVTFPDFGYGVTQSETDAEAMEMAQDLLMLTIGDYIRESRFLPTPRRHRRSKFRPVPLPPCRLRRSICT
jgi:antitoxin HicB